MNVPTAPARVCIAEGCTTTISRTSKGRCRPCSTKRLHDDPEIVARRAAARIAYHAQPGVKEAQRDRLATAIANLSEDAIERRRAHARKVVAERLHTPEAQAKALAKRCEPEAMAKRARSIAHKAMPWLPDHLIETYRELTRKGTPKDAARAALEPEIPGTAAHTARVLANFTDAQRIRAERERAQAY
ncbi:hypothetical protein [Sphingomonas sp. TREG-RG-20F-R18-01]|uniref:hypothetical protein n=1 Tax=Sphingomonas sp. TREG-RG-20F-R18-01 TaxID=2914982 RepID=UPI001F5A03F5|nr:hypothetical protein [Sphingomonas sp. TREG-RG-20F-R18-01]